MNSGLKFHVDIALNHMGDISGGHGDLVQCMPTWQFFKNERGPNWLVSMFTIIHYVKIQSTKIIQ